MSGCFQGFPCLWFSAAWLWQVWFSFIYPTKSFLSFKPVNLNLSSNLRNFSCNFFKYFFYLILTFLSFWDCQYICLGLLIFSHMSWRLCCFFPAFCSISWAVSSNPCSYSLTLALSYFSVLEFLLVLFYVLEYNYSSYWKSFVF